MLRGLKLALTIAELQPARALTAGQHADLARARGWLAEAIAARKGA